jgi:hypothetical protein
MMRKKMGRGMESDMCENGTMTLQGQPLIATIFPRVTHLLGKHVNHQGEIRKNV